MDTDPNQEFSPLQQGGTGSQTANIIDSGTELRPPLENFRPMELTSERALENRIADIEIRSNNDIDETDTIGSINNQNINAFEPAEMALQQSVDFTA